jgi:hypothetical protein
MPFRSGSAARILASGTAVVEADSGSTAHPLRVVSYSGEVHHLTGQFLGNRLPVGIFFACGQRSFSIHQEHSEAYSPCDVHVITLATRSQ